LLGAFAWLVMVLDAKTKRVLTLLGGGRKSWKFGYTGGVGFRDVRERVVEWS
jgi:hypothetical protein